jgi:lipoprotein-anchoring transpeptidase ErfK/SrfK
MPHPISLSTSVLALALFGALTSANAQTPQADASAPPSSKMDAVNAAVPANAKDAMLRAQVLLDRAHFSPGEIDAASGSNSRRAIAGFQASQGLAISGELDAPTWQALDSDAQPALIRYTLTAADVAGPFTAIPTDMMQKAALPALGYVSIQEALGERFHVSPALLARLNPHSEFAAGDDIVVPNVADEAALPKADKVVVDKSDATVSLVDAAGKTFAQFPATMGSEHDPLPLGEWRIQGVAHKPAFHYNPALFWDADPAHSKATIAPGPNNPVGVVWVDLSKDHYGIHGTPEPSKVGKTQSHGCIRLTNWDALTLAQAVSPGTVALLQE